VEPQIKKRKSGIPTGNAGEYLVLGELLRRGYDVQLADRNTKGYDVLIGNATDKTLRKVQVKTVRSGAWYINTSQFKGDSLDLVTIYVLLGPESSKNPVRYFIVKNRDVESFVERQPGWTVTAFMSLKNIAQHENRWETVLT
jgi:hypothetical protein